MFAERAPNDIQFFTAGTLISHTVRDGDELTLKSADQEVLVRDVRVIGPDHYSGTIYGFEPSHATEISGLVLDQRIEFYEKNIFGVRRA